MRIYLIHKLFFSLIVISFLISCQTSKIPIEIPFPSVVSIPPHIRTIVFADRTWKHPDCFIGFQKELSAISNYQTSFTHIDSDYMQHPASPLVWRTIADLIGNDTTRILVVLEDSYNGWRKTALPYRIYCSVYDWRMYDLKNKKIIDECNYYAQNLITTDSLTGRDYADRIAPRFFYDEREYYKKGNFQMRKAAKMVRYLHRDQAEMIWQKQSADSTSKGADRVFFNLAVAAELNGNFDRSLELAEHAKRSGNKKAEDYILLIKRHKRAVEQLKNEPEKIKK